MTEDELRAHGYGLKWWTITFVTPWVLFLVGVILFADHVRSLAGALQGTTVLLFGVAVWCLAEYVEGVMYRRYLRGQ